MRAAPAQEQGFLFAEKRLRIYVQTAIAQDSAFSIAPDDLVTHKAADPDKEANDILNRQQPPLPLRYGIVNNVAGCGQRRGAPQNHSQQ
jgi:hypothetical protein